MMSVALYVIVGHQQVALRVGRTTCVVNKTLSIRHTTGQQQNRGPLMLRRCLLRRPHRLCTRRGKHTLALEDAIHRGSPIDVHPEVQDALHNQRPIVALETTIVTHGMPYPTNLETARSVESIVRKNGAIPATIGIIEGRVKIGLHSHELERLADVSSNPSVVKVSRRDIGPVISLKRDGGTTCSSTLIFAALAGIKVFATGGLGGVHRGGESSMDVSADLQELTRCPVGLVSAGVKSILDIGRTLEYLETLGVSVISYGETDEFPAFYSRRSGFKSPWRVDNPEAAAAILYSQQQLRMSHGALFGVPIPEQYEAIGQELQQSVEVALQEAEEKGINKLGKEATPWLLKRVGELTKGKSLASNVALIENTAQVGAQIAVAYSNLVLQRTEKSNNASSQIFTPQASTTADPTSHPTVNQPAEDLLAPPASRFAGKLVVIGSAAIDVSARSHESVDPLSTKSTVPGTISLSLGGVGRNVAEAAHKVLSSTSSDLVGTTVLVSPIGDDAFGTLLIDEICRLGMRTDGITRVDSECSAVCNMVLDNSGNLVGGVADMDIIQSFHGSLAIEAIDKYQPDVVAVDGNLSEDCLKAVITQCVRDETTVFFEPTSITKSTRILPAIATALEFSSNKGSPVAFASPNLLELSELYRTASSEPLELTSHDLWWSTIESMALGSEFRMALDHLARRNVDDKYPDKGTLSFLVDKGYAQMAIHLLPFFQHLIIKCGDLGIITVFLLSGEEASTSLWSGERSNVKARQVISRNQSGGVLVLKHFPALELDKKDIINVTGAGDSLVGSLLASLIQTPGAFKNPTTLDYIIHKAQEAAVMTMKSDLAVSSELSISTSS